MLGEIIGGASSQVKRWEGCGLNDYPDGRAGALEDNRPRTATLCDVLLARPYRSRQAKNRSLLTKCFTAQLR